MLIAEHFTAAAITFSTRGANAQRSHRFCDKVFVPSYGSMLLAIYIPLDMGDWSLWARRGLCWPYYPSFCVWGRSVKRSNRGLLC